MAAPTRSDFYLGRHFDLAKGQLTDRPLEYDPADLTTHAVVTGMTGSGKTGLCVGLLEEAALNGIPALMVDPKGDLTNLLLHFPDLAPQDFEPWIDPDAARRQGKDSADLAAETAASWRKGLADWGIGPERIAALQEAADFAIYTPGSDAGLQISILASLQAPGIPYEGNREVIREKISSTVTALLGLVGLTDIDPVRSREHILLANIFERAWSQGSDLTLEELILQTQSPPFTKLGVFPIDSFYPEKDRFELAMLLNNFLASPAFQIWMEGQPLDVPSLLYTPSGKPRHSIFYLAHLPDGERMFFVTLLYSAVETWMRTQAGTGSLRALVYFDEILGYLPPLGNPPSKPVMLRMLKQARAFGVGMLLATQNPVDVDYKGLSNAGTWFIGKLQTDQDKQRLLDGLQSAAGGLDRAHYDRLISSLGKRVFLMHNVHEKQPTVFQTRWAMNFLAGPLTRAQIPALNRLAQAVPSAMPAPASPPQVPAPPPGALPAITNVPVAPAAPTPRATSPQAGVEGSQTRPTVPAGAEEYFVPNNLSLSAALAESNQTLASGAKNLGLIYKPALLAQAEVRYFNRKVNLDTSQKRTALVSRFERRGMVRWEDFPYPPFDPAALRDRPQMEVRYATLEGPLSDGKLLASLQKDFIDWVYRTGGLRLRANETLKVYASPEATSGEFRDLCSQAARDGEEAEAAKVNASFDSKLRALQTKQDREQRELDQDQEELSQRRMEEYGTHAENIFGLLGGRKRRVTTSLSKRRMSQQAKADVDESKQAIAQMEKDIKQLEAEKDRALQEVHERWARLAGQESEIPIVPMKKDIYSELFGVAWLPYYLIRDGEKTLELPGFEAARS